MLDYGLLHRTMIQSTLTPKLQISYGFQVTRSQIKVVLFESFKNDEILQIALCKIKSKNNQQYTYTLKLFDKSLPLKIKALLLPEVQEQNWT